MGVQILLRPFGNLLRTTDSVGNQINIGYGLAMGHPVSREEEDGCPDLSLSLRFKAGVFDSVVASRLVSLLGANPKVAAEIYRVLAVGGTARLQSVTGFSSAALDVFRKAGFRTVATEANNTVLVLVK